VERSDPHGGLGEGGRLTDDELEVLNHIGKAYSAFAELEPYHPAEQDELVCHVHEVCRIVMAR
jgi:hypothetical protein